MSYNFEKYLSTYSSTIELPGTGEVLQIRPLTTNDMKKLLVYENQQDPLVSEEVLDKIITDTVLTEGFDVKNLYLQDRYWIFIELRKVTKGTKYSFTYQCDKCKSQSIQNIDLDDLDVKKLNSEELEKEVELLGGNMKLEMDFITRGEQKEAYKKIDKKLSPREKQVEMIISDLAASIKSIETPDGKDENIPIAKKMELVGNLPGKEYDKLNEWHKNNDFGIDLNTTIRCPHCGDEKVEQIPLNNFFA